MKISANLWYKATRFYGSILALGIVLALAILLPSVLPPPPVAHATASTTQHQHPDPTKVTDNSVSYICKPTGGYSCTTASGYKGTNATGWAWTDYGCPSYASGCPNTPHNCTLYAAYRLMQNGVNYPGWYDNANKWAQQANLHGVAVNQTPAVGAIAQWNSGTNGHVAYVEASDSGGITLTMDDYYTSLPYPNGYTATVHINKGSQAWPDNFIHSKDQSNSNQPVFYAGKIVQYYNGPNTQNTSWFVSWDLKRYWIPDVNTYYCLNRQAFVIPSTLLNQLPDQTGKWARCGNNSLGTNQFLFRGSYLKSSNGQYRLELQSYDGNLVLYGPNNVSLWAIGTNKSADYLILQGDNNLVTYGYGVGATWATNTSSTGANTLVVKDDGNLILYTSGGVRIWDRYHGTRFIPGDCNGDGHVNSIDLSMLQSHYNQAYTPCDFNNDGLTNVVDLSILLSHYGT
jgi:surface antigen